MQRPESVAEILPPPPHILMVLTREIPDAPHSGRERTLSSIRNILRANYRVSSIVLKSLIEKPDVSRCFTVFSRLLLRAVRRKSWPLQVALFSGDASYSSLFRAIEETNADAVYFDGVRTLDSLIATRQRFPKLKLLCDFDDLMSLRFRRLLERDLPISLGYLEKVTPRWLQETLRRGPITRWVLHHEALSLQNAEMLAVQAADAVTVVSAADAEHLRKNIGASLSLKTFVIPPCVTFYATSIRTKRCQSFVFVGSDALLQNRLTIEFLIDLWRRVSPTTPLRIIGRMTKKYPQCEGVTFVGFVKDIEEVYRDDSIALCPSFIEGGIKTKVTEALAYGVIPVGNTLTFEGMGCDPGALSIKSEDFDELVANPQARIESLRDAASQFRRCIEALSSTAAVTHQWRTLVSGH